MSWWHWSCRNVFKVPVPLHTRLPAYCARGAETAITVFLFFVLWFSTRVGSPRPETRPVHMHAMWPRQ